ncbi:MAG: hypothetical protein GEU79_16100 [Acidimicrobiia bacterium]|nr:hypothetical protein [Acidimicrobiia bacterium]
MNRNQRARVMLALVGLLLASCSDDALAGIGAGPSDWISVSMPSTTVAPTTTLPAAFGVNDVTWFNDTLVEEVPDDPEQVLEVVRDRRSGDRFVQVSMAELGTVLPEVEIPATSVEPITHLTSQLVFESGSSDLNNDPVAAFGWWSAEPYTQSRSTAQIAVLTVALDSDSEDIGDSDLTCDRFPDREPCLTTGVGADTQWQFETATGITSLWYQEPYRYELFIRDSVEADLADRMRTSFIDIGSVLAEREANPPPSTTTTLPAG